MSVKISYDTPSGGHQEQTLTLDQAISLLSGKDFWRTRDIPELGLGALKFTDGPNGARGELWTEGKAAVCFPCATALGATFDSRLVDEIGHAIAVDARGKHAHGLLAPTVNIHRYTLNGRNFESYSEDPLLSGRIAAAYVRGVQAEGVAAAPKHFLANEVENGRRWSDSVIDERALREIFLEPFRIIVKEADPLCLMTSYNALNGDYCSESAWLIKLVREDWDFKGCMVSDWFGIYSTAQSLGAGLDLEMPGPTKFRNPEQIKKAIDSGEVSLEQVATSVQRVVDLLQKTGRIGLQDPQDVAGTLPEESSQPSAETLALLRRAAADGMVLLKNKNGALPLASSPDAKVNVIGRPAAEPSIFGGGSASLRPAHISTPLEALKANFPALSYSEGVSVQRLVDLASALVTEDVKLEWFNSPEPDETKLFRTETQPKSEYQMMEHIHAGLVDIQSFSTRMTIRVRAPVAGAYRLSLTSPGAQTAFLDGEQVADIPRGKDVITEDYIFNRARLERTVDLAVPLEAGREYTLTVVTRSAPHNPKHINREFYVQGSRVGLAPIPDDDSAIARDVELVKSSPPKTPTIIFVGTSPQWESEGFDRLTYALPLRQSDLISAVAKANTSGPTVVVINAGSAVDCTPWIDAVDAVVQAWFPGQEYGTAVADVLTGRVSPSGRLPSTIPRSLAATGAGDLTGKTEGPKGTTTKLVYHEGWAVGYRGANRDWYDPLFAFGHGLSYSRFAYSGVGKEVVVNSTADKGVDIRAVVTVTVRNEGDVQAAEVVQLYVQPPSSSSVDRPPVELRAFAKTARLAPGAEETVRLELGKEAFSFWDVETHSWKVEAGSYGLVFAGPAGVGDWVKTEAIAVEVENSFHWTK